MDIYECQFDIPVTSKHRDMISYLNNAITNLLKPHEIPIRLAITKTSKRHYQCEIGVIATKDKSVQDKIPSIFELKRRAYENVSQFNTVLVVPTGIAAEIGGHSGDGCVLSKLLGSVSDRVITHPNVVNAADINEMPDNTLYVEGSILSRFLMGTVDLQTVRSNRVLFIADKHKYKHFNNLATNSINAARACYGFSCPNIVELSPSVELKAKFTKEGRAIGTVKNIERIMQTLDSFEGQFDALAIATVIQSPRKLEYAYLEPNATLANPWGGVEAIFTHTISMLYNIPAAHSPMTKTGEEESYDPGVIDPRKAAEIVSLSFLQCILKGLQRSPRIIPSTEQTSREGILNVSDVSCLVIPDGCVGLPTLAALEQGIPVIAIRNNYNLMRNNLSDLPWAPGQFYMAENYLEAVGVIGAMKAGITLDSIQRPIATAKVSTMKFNK